MKINILMTLAILGTAAVLSSGSMAEPAECLILKSNLDTNADHLDAMGDLSDQRKFDKNSIMEQILDDVNEIITRLDNKQLNDKASCREWNGRVKDKISKGIDNALINKDKIMEKRYRDFKWK